MKWRAVMAVAAVVALGTVAVFVWRSHGSPGPPPRLAVERFSIPRRTSPSGWSPYSADPSLKEEAGRAKAFRVTGPGTRDDARRLADLFDVHGEPLGLQPSMSIAEVRDASGEVQVYAFDWRYLRHRRNETTGPLPTEDRAVAVARGLAQRVDFNLERSKMHTDNRNGFWSVGFNPVVDGIELTDHGMEVQIGNDGVVESVYGIFGTLTEMGTYPLAGTTYAIERLNESVRCGTSESSRPTTGATPASNPPACVPELGDQGHIVGVRRGLRFVLGERLDEASRRPGEAFLVPTYVLTSSAGPVAETFALDDRFFCNPDLVRSASSC